MDTTTHRDLAARRLRAQLLSPGRPDAPVTVPGVVARLVGVQAQDQAGAAWSVGLRAGGAVGAADVDGAVEDGAVVRCWAMRGTLHLVAAADLRWLLALLGPGVVDRNARRYRQLGLDDDTFRRAAAILGRALRDEGPATRARLADILGRSGVDASGQRAPYLLQRAALDGVLRHGPGRGRDQTYLPLGEEIPHGGPADRGAALVELAARYLAGHGPATADDFAWWSGLPAADARHGLAGVAPAERTVDGRTFLAPGDPPETPPTGALLLPAFDDALLGYRDRTAMLAPEHADRVNAGGGMPHPVLLLDGAAAGIWRRDSAGRAGVRVTVSPFGPLTTAGRRAVDAAAERYGRFLGRTVAVRLDGG